jgi:AbrB family looped-hinge helix DNA binding protein
MDYMKNTKSGIGMNESVEAISIYGTVKVGDRGQVVIPSKARKGFNIKSGDLLLVLAGRNRRGIAMVKTDAIISRQESLEV